MESISLMYYCTNREMPMLVNAKYRQRSIQVCQRLIEVGGADSMAAVQLIPGCIRGGDRSVLAQLHRADANGAETRFQAPMVPDKPSPPAQWIVEPVACMSAQKPVKMARAAHGMSAREGAAFGDQTVHRRNWAKADALVADALH